MIEEEGQGLAEFWVSSDSVYAYSVHVYYKKRGIGLSECLPTD